MRHFLFLLSLLMRLLPGDPAALIAAGAPDTVIRQIRHDIGLDRGVFGYYWRWLSGMLHGDFGSYYLNGGSRPVGKVIKATGARID